MDDLILARLMLMTKLLSPDIEDLLEAMPDPSCDICKRVPRLKVLTNCIFCEKFFCHGCCGKENTRICKVCNFLIATNVNATVLKQFSVKELRALTDNYNVPLVNVLEKEQMIEAILMNFKKSIKGADEPVVNVSELAQRMNEMRQEEDQHKERLVAIEQDRAKMFSDYSKVSTAKNDLTVHIDSNLSMDVTESDIGSMSIRNLKEFLSRYGIDYSGIIEKTDLVARAIILCQAYNNKAEAKNPQTIPKEINKELECHICMDNTINCVFIDCGHSMCCYECGLEVSICPLCRKNIKQCFKIVIG